MPSFPADQITDLVIRPLTSPSDLRAAVALQQEAWGDALDDITPPTVLKIVQKVGGISAGAFAPDGSLLGFIFGVTGVEKGTIVHWSHMMAVRADSQNRGVGRRLKEYQRAALGRIGAKRIYWTYDPLVARNAHLNFNSLGVSVAEYTRDMYPTMDTGAGTDRFIVAWPVDDAELAERRRGNAAARQDTTWGSAPVINPDPSAPNVDALAPRMRVQIPTDIAAVVASDIALAARWRASTRAAFERLLGAGYQVAGFVSDAEAGRGYYLLSV